MLVADTLTRRPDLLRERRMWPRRGPQHAGAARRRRGRHDALRAGTPRAAASSSSRRSAPCSRGEDDAPVVTLAEGLETVAASPRRCWPARSAARPWRWPRRRCVRAVVVALGKIGLPLAAQIARAGHEVVGCDIDAARGRARQRRAAAVPRRGRAGRGAGGGRRRRAPARARPTRRPRWPRARPRRRRAAAGGRRDAPARTGGVLDARRGRHRRAGCRPGRRSSVETTVPVGTTRNRVAPALARRSGLRAERRLLLRLQPRARLQRARLRATSPATPSSSAG